MTSQNNDHLLIILRLKEEIFFRAPSLALRMGTNLKIVCKVAYNLVPENKYLSTITWDDRENLKERKWKKPLELSLERAFFFSKIILMTR